MLTIIGSEYNPSHGAFEIYVSGCTRACAGCHNPEAQDFGKGKSARLWLTQNRYKLTTGTFDKVWILGGDLLCQPQAEAIEFVRSLRRAMPDSMELWLWTGAEQLKDVPCGLIPYLTYVKTGAYQQGTTTALVHYGNGGLMTLASANQKLTYVKGGRFV